MGTNTHLLVMLILSICNASPSQCEETTSCQARETEVTVTPTTFEEMINFFKFDVDLNQFLMDALTIELPILKESFIDPTDYDEDIDLNIMDMIKKYGFTPEVHEVTTEDGYILTMHRIVGNGPAVFMMHGILCSTDEWITSGPNNSLAFELASAGYDVWMGNARGNRYSRNHISLSPDCAQFWEFSWDQIGLIDVPTMIDFILNFTGQSSLPYVGYSQGTTSLVALCSEKPEYNEKISIAVLIAPAIYSSHWKSPLFRLLSINPEALYKFTELIGLHNPTPDNVIFKTIMGLICGNSPLRKFTCSNGVGLLVGYGRAQLNIARLPIFYGHFPSGASTRQFIHYGQMGRSGKFQKFNFTKEKNLEVYGSEDPPEYKPERVTTNTAVYYAEYDWVCNSTDVTQFIGELPNVVETKLLENLGHADILWGKNVKKLINEPIVALIGKYKN